MPNTVEMNPLQLSSGWEGLKDLRELGFVQTSFGPVDNRHFIVKVSLPFHFEETVPFYLYVRDANRNIELFISANLIVNMLLVPMARKVWYFCWAEILEEGTINFDTETDCKGW